MVYCARSLNIYDYINVTLTCIITLITQSDVTFWVEVGSQIMKRLKSTINWSFYRIICYLPNELMTRCERPAVAIATVNKWPRFERSDCFFSTVDVDMCDTEVSRRWLGVCVIFPKFSFRCFSGENVVERGKRRAPGSTFPQRLTEPLGKSFLQFAICQSKLPC